MIGVNVDWARLSLIFVLFFSPSLLLFLSCCCSLYLQYFYVCISICNLICNSPFNSSTSPFLCVFFYHSLWSTDATAEFPHWESIQKYLIFYLQIWRNVTHWKPPSLRHIFEIKLRERKKTENTKTKRKWFTFKQNSLQEITLGVQMT